jgi:predicted acylesterase/phospholipase RssA
MKSGSAKILCILSVLCTVVIHAERPDAPKKPFEKALVLSGGSLRTAAFLGAIDGCLESGYDPDVVVTTCGASLAAAIANAHEDRTDWLKYLESEEFFKYMQSVKVNPNFTSPLPLITGLAKMKSSQLYRTFTHRTNVATIPDLFSQYVVDLPVDSGLASLHRPFRAEGLPIILVGARLEYQPEDVGKVIGDRKLFTEVYFTDPQTARHLNDLKSFPARRFPKSYLAEGVEVYSGVPLYDAARASMSEPTLVQQKSIIIDGRQTLFSAGSVNGYPIEMAIQLADHVIAGASGPQGEIENIVYDAAFGMPLNERYRLDQNQPVDHWIDFTSWDAIDDARFGPELSAKELKFKDHFPSSHEEFKKLIRKQYKFGKQQALNAFGTALNSRKHLKDDILNRVGKLNGNDVIDATAVIARHAAAPLAAMETLRAESMESEEDDQSVREDEEEAQLITSYGLPLLTYGGLVAATDALRRYAGLWPRHRSSLRQAWRVGSTVLGVRVATNSAVLAGGASVAACKAAYRMLGGGRRERTQESSDFDGNGG